MNRPWITPSQVKEYSDFEDVSSRSDAKLNVDIRRAEAYIIKYCNNDFSATEYAQAMPEDVKIADMILAEYFAHNKSIIGKKTSETFDDYSYTSASSEIDVEELGLDTLLAPYIMTKASGRVTMRLRRL